MPRLTKKEKLAVWSFPTLVAGSIIIFLLYIGGSWVVFKVQQSMNNRPSTVGQNNYSLTLPCKDTWTKSPHRYSCSIIHNDKQETTYSFYRDKMVWGCSPSVRHITFDRNVEGYDTVFCVYTNESGYKSADAYIKTGSYTYSFGVGGPLVGDDSYYVGELESLIATLEIK